MFRATAYGASRPLPANCLLLVSYGPLGARGAAQPVRRRLCRGEFKFIQCPSFALPPSCDASGPCSRLGVGEESESETGHRRSETTGYTRRLVYVIEEPSPAACAAEARRNARRHVPDRSCAADAQDTRRSRAWTDNPVVEAAPRAHDAELVVAERRGQRRAEVRPEVPSPQLRCVGERRAEAPRRRSRGRPVRRPSTARPLRAPRRRTRRRNSTASAMSSSDGATPPAASRLRRRAPRPRRERSDAFGHARRICGPPQPRGARGADPRRRVGRESHAAGPVEPLGRARQAKIGLLGEVVRGRVRRVGVRAGQSDRQPTVRGDERRAARARARAAFVLAARPTPPPSAVDPVPPLRHRV